ncbi:hypothetical protein TNCV_3625091 [Trichonephila clavipes]|nr:hypothetical protein TNCV_3625091 [Trichonephila clavipes]
MCFLWFRIIESTTRWNYLQKEDVLQLSNSPSAYLKDTLSTTFTQQRRQLIQHDSVLLAVQTETVKGRRTEKRFFVKGTNFNVQECGGLLDLTEKNHKYTLAAKVVNQSWLRTRGQSVMKTSTTEDLPCRGAHGFKPSDMNIRLSDGDDLLCCL